MNFIQLLQNALKDSKPALAFHNVLLENAPVWKEPFPDVLAYFKEVVTSAAQFNIHPEIRKEFEWFISHYAKHLSDLTSFTSKLRIDAFLSVSPLSPEGIDPALVDLVSDYALEHLNAISPKSLATYLSSIDSANVPYQKRLSLAEQASFLIFSESLLPLALPEKGLTPLKYPVGASLSQRFAHVRDTTLKQLESITLSPRDKERNLAILCVRTFTQADVRKDSFKVLELIMSLSDYIEDPSIIYMEIISQILPKISSPADQIDLLKSATMHIKDHSVLDMAIAFFNNGFTLDHISHILPRLFDIELDENDLEVHLLAARCIARAPSPTLDEVLDIALAEYRDTDELVYALARLWIDEVQPTFEERTKILEHIAKRFAPINMSQLEKAVGEEPDPFASPRPTGASSEESDETYLSPLTSSSPLDESSMSSPDPLLTPNEDGSFSSDDITPLPPEELPTPPEELP